MDLFFLDPDEIPLPPEEVRIRDLNAEPFPDGRRVRVILEVDPFQKRPNLDILITDPAGKPAAIASIIESMTKKIEITMHLRGANHTGQYLVRAELYYRKISEAGTPDPSPPIITQVDLAETFFTIDTQNSEADIIPGKNE
ncbi:MAG TPA: hypothetical protein VN363_05015 [Anaerolineales bacterium]|nr:hypothetical protein [Anaerolineales bacterium]